MTPALAFFNNKGGVGKTTLCYHMAWMFAELGAEVLVVDLDPQANLTSMFLDDDQLESIWPDADDHPQTIQGVVAPLLEGTGDIGPPPLREVAENIHLVPGDMALSVFEDELSLAWPRCLDRRSDSFRTTTAFLRMVLQALGRCGASVVLVDVGPNLGAINRAALLVCHGVVFPLAADLFSLQGLRNLGPTLRQWRRDWNERVDRMPPGVQKEFQQLLQTSEPQQAVARLKDKMQPLGYLILQHAVRLDRPVKAYARWASRIPALYREKVLNAPVQDAPEFDRDPHCLGQLKHYRSLMPLAMEARKPIFLLRPADGAIGAHMQAVKDCYLEFQGLAQRLADKVGLRLPLLERLAVGRSSTASTPSD